MTAPALREPGGEDEDEPFDYGDSGCNRCGGEGYVIVCPDDICRGAGECMHGDGEVPCPECDRWGEPGERVSSFGRLEPAK